VEEQPNLWNTFMMTVPKINQQSTNGLVVPEMTPAELGRTHQFVGITLMLFVISLTKINE
jgi:hypothetical protein